MTTKADPGSERVNPYSAGHNYCRFQTVLLVDQITVIGMKCMTKHQDLQIFVL